MNEDRWYFGQGGRQMGPVGFEQLRALAANGALHYNDLVWRAGMAQWQVAGSILELGMLPPLPTPVSQTTEQIPYATRLKTLPPPVGDLGQSAGMRMVMPVGVSGWAIAAGYAGLFSLLLFPAPLAMFFSFMAYRDIRRNPGKHGMVRTMIGLVLGTLCTTFLVVGLVVTFCKK